MSLNEKGHSSNGLGLQQGLAYLAKVAHLSFQLEAERRGAEVHGARCWWRRLILAVAGDEVGGDCG
jgi:hypothetical protein